MVIANLSQACQPIAAAAVKGAQRQKPSGFSSCSFLYLREYPMNKVIAALIAGLFAVSAYAQTTPATPAVVKAEAKAEKADTKAVKSEMKVDAKADASVAKAEAKAAKAKKAEDAKAAKAEAKAAKAKKAEDAKVAKAEAKAAKAKAKAGADTAEVKAEGKADVKAATVKK